MANLRLRWLLVTVAVSSIIVSFESTFLQRLRSNCLTSDTEDVLEKPVEPYSYSSPSAEDIVSKAYNKTYAHLVQTCPQNVNLKTCIRETIVRNSTNFPWWFRSLLRDASERPLHGFWHHLSSNNPSVRMCTIEKVGIKQWKKLFCGLNTGKFPRDKVCGPKTAVPQTAPKFVFLRDPLERFLSAFLDKCVFDRKHRHIAPHCEPRPIFEAKKNDLTKDLVGTKQTFFEAYVDTLPLKWNLHFFPLGLYCDGLFRQLNQYDLVGFMGPNFYNDLHNLGQRYGENMTKSLNVVFHVEDRLAQANFTSRGVETSAVSHVKEYYTPRTVRRVLEYVSIDYVTLNLQVPEWARQMLQEK